MCMSSFGTCYDVSAINPLDCHFVGILCSNNQFFCFSITGVTTNYVKSTEVACRFLPILVLTLFVGIRTYTLTEDPLVVLYGVLLTTVLLSLASLLKKWMTFMAVVCPEFTLNMIRYGLISFIMVFSPVHDLETNALIYSRQVSCIGSESLGFVKKVSLELYEVSNKALSKHLGPVTKVAGVASDIVNAMSGPVKPNAIYCAIKEFFGGSKCVYETQIHTSGDMNTTSANASFVSMQDGLRSSIQNEFGYIQTFYFLWNMMFLFWTVLFLRKQSSLLNNYRAKIEKRIKPNRIFKVLLNPFFLQGVVVLLVVFFNLNLHKLNNALKQNFEAHKFHIVSSGSSEIEISDTLPGIVVNLLVDGKPIHYEIQSVYDVNACFEELVPFCWYKFLLVLSVSLLGVITYVFDKMVQVDKNNIMGYFVRKE